jgi:hypothetical protein
LTLGIDEAHQLRAEGVADAVRHAWTAAAGGVRRLTDACRRFLLAVADGVAAARRYEKLASMSDAELARLGITREDVPWFAYSGERPARPGRGSSSPTPGLLGKPKAANVSTPRYWRQARHPRPGESPPAPTSRVTRVSTPAETLQVAFGRGACGFALACGLRH